MKNNFAKGVWEVHDSVAAPRTNLNNCIIVSCDGGPVCIVTDNWIPDRMNEANALLISKAPELLASVVKLQEKLETLINATPTGDARNALTDLNIETLKLIEDANAKQSRYE